MSANSIIATHLLGDVLEILKNPRLDLGKVTMLVPGLCSMVSETMLSNERCPCTRS